VPQARGGAESIVPPTDGGESLTCGLISWEFAFSSGAYIAPALVGNVLNFPGISAHMR